MPLLPVQPRPGATALLSVTTTSSRVAIGGDAQHASQVRVSSETGNQPCFIEFGGSSVVAVVFTGLHMVDHVIEILTVPPGTTHMAAITASSTGVLYVQRLSGI